MADPTDLTNEAKAATSNMKAALDMSEKFYEAGSKATGKVAELYDRFGAIYSKIAANNSEILKSEEKIRDAIKERRKLEEEIEKEKSKGEATDKLALATQEKRLAQVREDLRMEREKVGIIQQNVAEQKKAIDAASQSTGIMSRAFGSLKTKAEAFIMSTERLASGLKGIGGSAQDILNLSVKSGTFFGMTGDYAKDFENIGAAAIHVNAQMLPLSFTFGRLGISMEEGTAAFYQFSQIARAPIGGAAWAKELGIITESASVLSSELGLNLNETTEFFIEGQKKFGQSAGQSADALFEILDASKKVNADFGRTIFTGHDVAKTLFDITRESRSASLEQKLLATEMATNMIALQAQGLNYRAALEGASTFIKKMTTEAPDWGKIMAGKQLLDQVTNMTPALRAQLNQAKIGLADEIDKVAKDADISPFVKQQRIQAMLSGTGVGLRAMEDQVYEVIQRSGKNAALAVKEMYGITDPLQQQAFISQATQRHKLNQEQDDFHKKSLKTIQEEYGISEELAKRYKDSKDEVGLRGIIAERERKSEEAALKKKDETAKKEIDDRVKELEEAKKQGKKPDYIASLQSEIDRLTGSLDSSKKRAEAEMSKRTAVDTLTGGFWRGAMNVLQTNTGKMAEGVLGLFGLLSTTGVPALVTMAAVSAGGIGAAVGIKASQWSRNQELSQHRSQEEGSFVRDTLKLERMKEELGKAPKPGEEKTWAEKRNFLDKRIADIKQIHDKAQAQIGPDVTFSQVAEELFTGKKGNTDFAKQASEEVAKAVEASKKAEEGRLGATFEPVRAGAVPETPSTLEVNATPVATPAIQSSTPQAPGTTSPNMGGGAGGTIQQTASLISGSQGTDIQLITLLPIALATAENLKLMQRGVGSPAGP